MASSMHLLHIYFFQLKWEWEGAPANSSTAVGAPPVSPIPRNQNGVEGSVWIGVGDEHEFIFISLACLLECFGASVKCVHSEDYDWTIAFIHRPAAENCIKFTTIYHAKQASHLQRASQIWPVKVI